MGKNLICLLIVDPLNDFNVLKFIVLFKEL